MPNDPSDLSPLFRQMRQRGEITPIQGLPHLYEITVPYARTGSIAEDEVLLEVHPYAALSHRSALVFHGLTTELPTGITMLAPSDGRGDLLPLGTEPRDWDGVPLVQGRTPRSILGRPVTWTKVKPERYFGLAAYQPRGYLVRVTSPERTLLDGLQAPELSGGIENVLRAWALARDTLDLEVLVGYVERFRIGILRQRVGFILDALDLSHSHVERWRDLAQRGGSSKLVAAAPYASSFDERWNLSLNAPITALQFETA